MNMNRNYSNARSRKARRRRHSKRRSNYKVCYTLILLTLLAIVSAIATTAATALKISDTERYIVSGGDTLWSIASEYNTEAEDVRDVMDDIMRLNGMKTPQLRIGEAITVPIY